MTQPRMKQPALVVPGALQALLAVDKILKKGDVPNTTLYLVQLRASQINGCSFCIDMHCKEAKQAGETDERLWSVAAFREATCFSDAERAALELTECATRLSDRAEPVPDDVYARAAKHYDENALASLILNIAMINFWNRLNVTTRQPPARAQNH
jgi:AhpD family alkylhydroperoxidase